MGSRVGSIVALLAVVAAVVAVLALSGGSDPVPFDAASAEPDGYRAVSLLLEDGGASTVTTSAEELDPAALGGGDAVVVPVAEWLTEGERSRLMEAASNGATVVLAAEDSFIPIDRQSLVRTPALPVARGRCDIAEIDDLESLDDIAFWVLEDPDPQQQLCFADGVGALVSSEAVGAGTVVRLSSPYLWANARLQPDKEDGGQPLDNGPMAVQLLAGVGTVHFVEAVPPAGVTPDGTQNPIQLMPLTVKMAIIQAAAAFVFYAWWRGRRLGAPVRESVPVEVAGSELVEAVGGLLRRHGSVGSAASVLRERECRELAAALGVPREAGPDALVSAVSARTRRQPEDVAATLFGPAPGGPSELLELTRKLDSLHSEVLDVEPAT